MCPVTFVTNVSFVTGHIAHWRDTFQHEHGTGHICSFIRDRTHYSFVTRNIAHSWQDTLLIRDRTYCLLDDAFVCVTHIVMCPVTFVTNVTFVTGHIAHWRETLQNEHVTGHIAHSYVTGHFAHSWQDTLLIRDRTHCSLTWDIAARSCGRTHCSLNDSFVRVTHIAMCPVTLVMNVLLFARERAM